MASKGFHRAVLVILLVCAVVAFFKFNLSQYLTLDFIKTKQSDFDTFYQDHPVQTISLYMLIYITVTAVSLPGAAILTLVGGALFGVLVGTVIVSFASTIGATLAFVVARFLLRDYVQETFGERLARFNRGIQKEGAFYLFTLRMIPVVPFFVINLVMALTPMRVITFFWVSQVGMLLGTLAYVNAGTQLAQIDTLQGIMSPGLLLSFIFLAFVPFIAKGIIKAIRKRNVYKPFSKPQKFDYNLIVIGAGAAGLVSAYIASAIKAKVAIIEKHKMGGDCLNTGCVPSKALIRSAKVAHTLRNAAQFGVGENEPSIDFSRVMARIETIIKQIEPHDSIERYTNLGVDCIQGHAEIVDPYRIRVNDTILTTRNIIIATGAEPFVPDIPGLKDSPHYTSDTIWSIRTLPKRLVVLGGGPIGCELAQSFQRLGAHVTIVEQLPRILAREDEDVSSLMTHTLETEGVSILTGHAATTVIKNADDSYLACKSDQQTTKIPFDALLVAIGRKANVSGMGLESLGVELNTNGTIASDEFLRTRYPNVYVCGDVAGPYQFTHTASHQAWFATVNALFSPLKSFSVDYRVIPWATFTDPEVATVGLNEVMAQNQNIAYEITRYNLQDLDRAIVDSDNQGFVKVLTIPGKDTLLGATIVGPHAGEIITEFVLAMKYRLGLNKLLGTIHVYPTLMEANKFAAGNWKKSHTPQRTLKWLARFHAWRR